jgi:hypothetical protein
MSGFGRSIFTGIPVEYAIPKSTKVVWVNDFFVKDVQGGAELTSEAIIRKSPHKVFRMHSSSVTPRLLESNKDKYWVFGNFAALPEGIITSLPSSGVRYSIVEYDFKFCAYRSTNRHQQATGQPCNCAKDVHGLNISKMFQKADRIFWMSEGQKAHWLKNVPALADHKGHMVLSSVFDDETLDLLASYRHNRVHDIDQPRVHRYGVLGSGSWIKGVEETQKWCKLNRKPFEAIPGMPYRDFIKTLAMYQGFVFMPLDYDTCPRVTIEAKLMGLELIMNENVLQKNDDWFKGSPEECEAYLRTRASAFWMQLPV